jgi:hypothetical protein
MERRRAIAVSLVGAALVVTVLVLVVALVRMDGGGLAGDFAPPDSAAAAGSPVTTTTGAPAEAVTVYEDVYELSAGRVAADTGPSEPEDLRSVIPPTAAGPSPLTDLASPRPAPTTPTATGTVPPTTPAPTTTTTTATAKIEVPEDWPPGKPLHPMPPGCREPHLEDNGEWNCQH